MLPRPGAAGAAGGEGAAGGAVAAFDFDGTLVRGDSLIGFLRLVCGARATGLALADAVAGPAALALARGTRLDRDVAKAAVLARLLVGRRLDSLVPLAEAHAARLAARVRPSMRAVLAGHRAKGHRIVIVSASPELYLVPAGRLLGVDAVLATRLQVDGEGRLTGALEGLNCRGPEKTARLQSWLGSSALLHAYGDSAGDDELLAMAEVGTWVGRRAWTRRRLATGAGE